MDHYMEPLSSQAIVDEDNNQDAIVDANVSEMESQCDNNEPPLTATPVRANHDDDIPQPPAPKRPRKNQTSTGTHGGNTPHRHLNESSNLPRMMLLEKKMISLPL